MKRVGFVIALVAVAAACTPAKTTTYRDLDRIGEDYARTGSSPIAADTCHMAEHRNLIGVERGAIDSANLPEGTRVICFGCASPRMDTPTRLNLQLGADQKVAGLRCG